MCPGPKSYDIPTKPVAFALYSVPYSLVLLINVQDLIAMNCVKPSRLQ